METGLILSPWIGRTARVAKKVEELGFSTLLLTDSQNLAPEVFTQLMVAAQATTRLRIGTGVTNPVTRDSAVLASAALSLQAESNGRMVLGLGRGDSAVQRIGKDLYPLSDFRRYVNELQAYLGGAKVERGGFESQLEWHRFIDQPKVPLQIAATGPKVVELAAQQADAVMLAIGADVEHVGAALAHARAAAKTAGRAPGSVRFGAFVNVVMHPDVNVARTAVRGAAASFARFSSFKGSPIERLPPPLQSAVAFLREHYDMKDHTRESSPHARAMEDQFVDWFALAGPTERVLPRFEALAALGLDFIYMVSASSDTAREVARTSLAMLSRDVLPMLAAR
jgi:5,10-methylenetetrahydromethanopterin reductase